MGNQQDSGRCLSSAAEEWRPVVGYEGHYEVSSLGQVRNIHGRLLAQHDDGQGYRQLGLSCGSIKTTYRVHRLVCRAFHGVPSEGFEVAHLDGNRANAASANLAWATPSENNRHKEAHGTHQAGESAPRAKLSAAAVAAIRASQEPHNLLAAEFGVNESAIRKIRKGERWAA